MKKKLISFICALSMLSSTAFASEDLGYNRTLSGDKLPTIVCNVGDFKTTAILYKGHSYISLSDLEKLDLKGFDPIRVKYSKNITGSLYDFISFDIPITKNGEIVVHIKGELNKDINPTFWIMYLVADGKCNKYTINNVTEYIINNDNQLYIPLSYLRDICNIKVDWLGSDTGITLSGDNTIYNIPEVMYEPDVYITEEEYNQMLKKEKDYLDCQSTSLWSIEYDKYTTDYERLNQSKSSYNLLMGYRKECLLKLYNQLSGDTNKQRYNNFMYHMRVLQLWLSSMANNLEETYKNRTTLYDDKGLIVPYEVIIEASKAAEDMYNSTTDYSRACCKYFEILCEKLSQQ